MKAIIMTLSYLTIMLACVFIILLIIDTFQVVTDPSSHLFSIEENWFQKSSCNYIIGNLLSILVLGVFSFIGIRKIQLKSNRLFNAIYMILMIAFLALILCGYFQWYLSGFDHY
jgi:hypothetical protein